MEGLGTAPARTEADLRAALAEQARRAPSADDVLSALRRAGSRPRRRHQPAWAAPVAAAAAMVLVIGLAVAVSHELFGTRQPGGAANRPAAPLPFYVTTDAAITKIVVRSTATGKVAAVVPVNPSESSGEDLIAPALATGENGTFYVAALQRGVREEQIYRFRLTAAGRITGFARVPGGGLRPGWAADALAASANGSRIAVGASYYGTHVNPGPEQSDQVVVINAHTGAQRTWLGGALAGGYKFFRVGNLSWADGPRELAVLGAWCRAPSPTAGDENCSPARQAQLRAINPAGRGGSVLDGRLLLGQAPHTYLAQALLSPNGSVITAMVLRGKIVGNKQVAGGYPAHLSVERVSAATGRTLGVIYRRYLGDTSMSGTETDPLALIANAAGSQLILDSEVCGLHCTNEFNGWLDGRRLVPLLPTGFAHREAAEAW
jgi:hypothetical protein